MEKQYFNIFRAYGVCISVCCFFAQGEISKKHAKFFILILLKNSGLEISG
jgi:hypothetical protein